MNERSWVQVLKSSSDNRKSKTCAELGRTIRNRKWVGIVAAVVTFAMCGEAAMAQQEKVHHIGLLVAGESSAVAGRIDAFRQGLRERGYEHHHRVSLWRRKVRSHAGFGSRTDPGSSLM